EVIRAPLVSEKGTLLAESTNQVLFKVRPEANKIEVRQAVESLFKVKVVKVRIARYLGKVRRVGRNMGRRPGWKKAYVTLKEGDKIDLFGGA
ncbi:MAG: 50S ribosomal protein L23, partial [Deltaproteobacteria bacterium]|nr:50S ribosomal protein L23 [Deltaproteobacteria bacterium]